MKTKDDFTHITTNRFNHFFDTALEKNDCLHKVLNHLEDEGYSIFYASYSDDDILDAMIKNEETDTILNLNIDLWCIDDLYIAINYSTQRMR